MTNMPTTRPPDGLYLVRCHGAPITLGKPNVNLPVEHYAIMDVGNRFGLEEVDPSQPVIIHQTPANVRIEPTAVRGEQWTIVERIVDVAEAKKRFEAALNKPDYNLADNNCEHFARFVANGKRESTQLMGYAVASAVTLVIVGAVKLFSKLRS